MIKRFGAGVGIVMLILFSGCFEINVDQNKVIKHPEQVAPSSVFDVVLINIYLYLTGDTVAVEGGERDSLHLLVGLPDKWEIENAAMAVSPAMSVAQLLALKNNTMDNTALNKLVGQLQENTSVLPSDDVLAEKISGDSLQAHDKQWNNYSYVSADAVPVWKGFSEEVAISIARPDTMLPKNTVLALAKEFGIVDDATLEANSLLIGLMPEKMGISVIPVVVSLKVKAGPEEGNDTLYYFSITDSMNPPPLSLATVVSTSENSSVLSSLGTGDMTFIPVTVSKETAVLSSPSYLDVLHKTDVSYSRTGGIHFTFGTPEYYKNTITVYSLEGSVVTRLKPDSRTVFWDGCGPSGSRVRPGVYIARITGTADESLRFRMLP